MGMRRFAAFVVILTAAGCNATSTISTVASPTRTSSPVATQSASTPAAELAVVPPIIHCRIPVYAQTAGIPDGFISFPSGTWTSTGTSGGYYYDYAVGRWLPVPRQAVAPDGRRYAYTEGWGLSPSTAPRLHIVDAATGHDLHVFTMPEVQPFVVVDFAGDGVYLIIAYEGVAPGVWRVNPITGGASKVSDGYYIPAGPTWFSVVDPKDPNPVRSAESGQPQPDRVDYRDAAGQTTTWFYRPGYAVAWAPFSGLSEILVEASRSFPDPVLEYWLVGGPGQATRLAAGPMDPSNPFDALYGGIYSAISDSYGVWMGGSDGLYLIGPTGVIIRAYGQAAFPANGCF